MRVLSFILLVLALAGGLLFAGERPDFREAREVLLRAIADRAFPGCAVAAGTSEEVLWLEGFGRLDYSGAERVSAATLYDLASLTKVVGTTSVVLALVRDRKLSLLDPLARHVPEFHSTGAHGAAHPGPATDADWRPRVRIEHVLTHSTGLPAWRALHHSARSYTEVLARAASEPLEAEPGSRAAYSDLGFILLGEAAARAGGKPLADLEQELVFSVLGMRSTTRRPEPGAEVGPTEARPRGEANGPGQASSEDGFLRGIVHDENARAAGGLTGHAGLFSSASDLSRFAGEVLRGLRGRSEVFPREILRDFVRRRDLVAGSSRALGWDTPSGRSSAGTLFGPSSFGHTGFTGTSIWLDPDRDLYLVLLSNRVHPSRDNAKIAAVRPALANAVAKAFDAVYPRRQRI
jgi:CubicO group peptidase (beta-lactamase class C family)